jgi:hypothetical protein
METETAWLKEGQYITPCLLKVRLMLDDTNLAGSVPFCDIAPTSLLKPEVECDDLAWFGPSVGSWSTWWP